MNRTMILAGVAALAVGMVPSQVRAQQTPAAQPYSVGNPLGLPVTPAPGGAFEPVTPNVKVYGAIYSAES